MKNQDSKSVGAVDKHASIVSRSPGDDREFVRIHAANELRAQLVGLLEALLLTVRYGLFQTSFLYENTNIICLVSFQSRI